MLPLLVIALLAQWREGSVIGVPTDHTRTVLWVGSPSTATIPSVPIPPNAWTVIDLADGPQWGSFAPHLPEDTLAVSVSGIAVTTNASAQICNMTGQFRAPGSQMSDGQYRVQSMAIPGNGDRSNVSMWVPVSNRKVEFYWTYTPAPGCTYALSLTLDAYLRGASAPPLAGKWFRVCTDAKTCFEGLLTLVGG